jgi:WD40 repeat protein
VTASSDGTLKCWDAGNGELIWTLAPERREKILSIDYSGDGGRIVVGFGLFDFLEGDD